MSALRDALRDLADDIFFDLLESEGAYLLVVDVPGVAAESLEVGVDDDRLSIDARREKAVPGEYRYVEENRPLFVDVDLPLPEDASASGLQATVERGVLEVEIPKRTSAETTIDVADPDGAGASDDSASGEPAGDDASDSAGIPGSGEPNGAGGDGGGADAGDAEPR